MRNGCPAEAIDSAFMNGLPFEGWKPDRPACGAPAEHGPDARMERDCASRVEDETVAVIG